MKNLLVVFAIALVGLTSCSDYSGNRMPSADKEAVKETLCNHAYVVVEAKFGQIETVEIERHYFDLFNVGDSVGVETLYSADNGQTSVRLTLDPDDYFDGDSLGYYEVQPAVILKKFKSTKEL